MTLLLRGGVLGGLRLAAPARFVRAQPVDRDIMACPVDEIRDVKVLATAVAGKVVYSAKP